MLGVQIHTLLTHFPIAVTVAAFFYDALGFYSRRTRLFGIGSSLTRFAAVTSVLAVASGFRLAGVSGLGSGGAVTGHAGLGTLTAIILVALTLIRYSAEARRDSIGETFRGLWLGVEALAVILVGATAIIGHRM